MKELKRNNKLITKKERKKKHQQSRTNISQKIMNQNKKTQKINTNKETKS